MGETEPTAAQDSAAVDAVTEPVKTQAQDQVDDTAAKLNNLTLRIWPPSQSTRDAVINRLVETLSSQSVLSTRYGTIPEDEASSIAKSIEEEAFSLAGKAFSPDVDDGIEILQMYSKEISKRMLDTVKSRASATAPSDAPSGTEASNGEIPSSSLKEEA